jgi:hypothetical protein
MNLMLCHLVVQFVLLLTVMPSVAVDLDWVRIFDDGKGFTLAESDRPFVPWGFNYDHEGDRQLLDDDWVHKWATVESAFREMKDLRANVVRIHRQSGKYPSECSAACQPSARLSLQDRNSPRFVGRLSFHGDRAILTRQGAGCTRLASLS